MSNNNNPFSQNPVGFKDNEALTWADVSSTAQDKSKQLTYTTVGSIYNPDAVAQLQPPSRRPRTRRYPHVLESSSLGLQSELYWLSVKDNKAPVTPPISASALQQYTPLQQNDDRAVNPTEITITNLERSVLSDLDMTLPTIRSGNLPPPFGLDDEDSVASEDTLASSRITVKGLTNLASYPNPMQKAAQKALARARPANLTISRPGTPPSFTHGGFGKDRAAAPYGATSGTNGPPQPLTAGPPGRRDLRPQVEELFRTSRLGKAAEEPMDYSVKLGNVPRSSTALGSTYDWVRTSAQSVQQPKNDYTIAQNHTSHNLLRPTALPQPSRPTTPISQLLDPDNSCRKDCGAAAFEQTAQNQPNAFDPVYAGSRKTKHDDWHMQSTLTATHQEDPFSRSSDSAEKGTNQSRLFYAGSECLVEDMDLAKRNSQHGENKFGVIGGERGRFRESHIGSLGQDNKARLVPMSIQEAVQKTGNDYARPLISLAYASILNYKEDGQTESSMQRSWRPKFTEVNDEWVDHSEEGNKSFFDKPKEPIKKKKLVVKKTNLGY